MLDNDDIRCRGGSGGRNVQIVVHLWMDEGQCVWDLC